jgi:anti-sigma B factor antagonist
MGGRGSDLKLTTLPGSPAVVSAVGSFDIATVVQLEDAVTRAMAPGGSVVLDLAGVTVCDSTGLGALVRLQRHARAIGTEFAVRRPRPHVADVFAMTGINKVIAVRDD